MFEECAWLNPPPAWSVTAEGLRVTTAPGSDFWRETHYGFTRDSGHFFGRAMEGDFTATLRIRGRYAALYDQAGIMLRRGPTAWIKAGIELSDGEALLGSVLTLGRSDWATGAFRGDAGELWLRATLAGGVLRLQASADGRRWPLLRLCGFPGEGPCAVGPMACSPEGRGLEVLFSDFTVTPPLSRDLHDLA
ncbi:DUF1349 domain-containing protein [Roseomonas sp. 18066]|uniref:DUF1349 domain-containing protein n=1 Tax=Roseomonas sp. 18066 TaxID=2681412 RepID=UPI00135BCFF6|nr:DUF1349 domain-containing protein [Roseomonas sp. 18066]